LRGQETAAKRQERSLLATPGARGHGARNRLSNHLPMTMDSNDENSTKARRAQIILYVVMAVFIFGPLVIYWLRR